MVHCPKCQAENDDSAKFCAKCGAELNTNTTDNPVTTTEAINEAPAKETATSTTETTTVATPTTASVSVADSTAATAHAQSTAESAAKPAANMPNFFSFVISAVVKPISTFREQLNKYSSFNNAAIITVISSAFAMLCGLVVTIFGAIIVKRCSLFGGNCKTSVEFENLGDLDWLGLTLLSFIVYVLAIALVSGIYFGMSRAFKRKETNFFRMMTVVATAFVPMALGTLVGGLVALLNATIGGLFISAGSVYGFYMLYEGLNDEAKITGDKKVYYNFLNILILLVIVVVLVLIMNQSGGLDASTKMLDLL